MKKFVYLFNEGNAEMRDLLGGKGANLAEMSRLGLPVPSGFTVSTEACTNYYENNEALSNEIVAQIFDALKLQEEASGKKLGDLKNPLLVSVRSGARVSMPGMMDTILNLGLNDQTVETLSALSKKPRFAYDCYRRFIQMFGEVAMGVDSNGFEKIIDEIKQQNGFKLDLELGVDELKEIIKRYKSLIKSELGVEFPQEPKEQLIQAVTAVFRSWNNPRAIVYRRINDIPESWGTAVTVQQMVFGNLNDLSGTGVAFSRNPTSGENQIYGEFMWNAQGEDIVSGARTPLPIEKLNEKLPEVYKQFVFIAKELEKHYKDMQDMEFTIENGELFLLQTRIGKRTAQASLQIAVDLVSEGLKTRDEAILSLDPKLMDTLLHKQFLPESLKSHTVVAKGLPASPGAASGQLVLNSDTAKELKKKNIKTVLVRLETSAKDIEGMTTSEGILTGRGGMTSHAAVVARGLGAPCVVGCSTLFVNEEEGYVLFGSKRVNAGELISIDGSTGNVYLGEIETTPAKLSENFSTILSWCNSVKKIGVRANADTPTDTKVAMSFGADGVGLVRTEHMFFKADKIIAIREMIVATTLEERQKALDKLYLLQRADFEGIFTEANGKPVTIRLIDPPLHEFLPKEEIEQEKLAKDLNISLQQLQETINGLQEFNPMMGHRGCRLAVTFPEIAVMQTRAIIDSAISVTEAKGLKILPEIMIPLVVDVKEFNYVKQICVSTAEEILKGSKTKIEYKIGTMIETPRATIVADELAKEADFFSFGTNDLTQLTFGFSRDDSGKFIDAYYEKHILDHDPFVRIDEHGVGKLIDNTIKMARSVKPNFKIGVCGEQGSNGDSIKFFLKEGVSYVSCSPYRVPLAILSSAIASLKKD